MIFNSAWMRMSGEAGNYGYGEVGNYGCGEAGN